MNDREQNIDSREGNFNPDAKGCFLAFIPGITGLLKKVNQRREDAQIRREQRQALSRAFDQQRWDIINVSVEQHIAAQAAGIYLPMCRDPLDPIGNHLFEHQLRKRLGEVGNLLELVRQFQEETSSANIGQY